VIRSSRWVVLVILFTVFIGDVIAQQFKNPKLIHIGGSPRALATGDFNRDGKIDLICVDSVIHVLLGNGNATFNDVQQLPLGTAMGASLTVADVNNDGVKDLLVGDWGPSAQVDVYLANGDGTFKPAITSTIFVPNYLWAGLSNRFGIGDLNGDGNPDIIAPDIQNNAIYTALGDGHGKFAYKGQVSNNSAPGELTVGDFNSDGKVDFLVHGRLGADLYAYPGSGDGTFQPATRITTPQNVTSYVSADFNHDGRIDVAVTGFDQSITILQGNSDGTFSAVSGAGISNMGPAYSVLTAAVDVNGDNIPDLVTQSESGLGILLGNSDLTFRGAKIYPAGPYTTLFEVADFNGDNHPDFVVAVGEGVALLLGNTDGSIQTADSYDVGKNATTAAIADFNGDSFPDVAVALSAYVPKILMGKGNGTFTVNSQALSGAAGPTIVTGDFNGDRKQDLFVLDSGGAQTQLGHGDGTFGPLAPVPGLTIIGFAAVSPGDFNGDGKTDLFVLNYESYNVLTATGGGNFNVSSVFVSGVSGFVPPAVGDLNKDGKLDVVFSIGVPRVYLGRGDGTFQEGRTLWTPLQGYQGVVPGPGSLTLGDVDGDGNLDLLGVMGRPDVVVVYYGLGDGSFQDPVGYPTATTKQKVVVADVNHDGRMDFVLADTNYVSVMYNLGSMSFGPETSYVAGPNINDLHVADLNGDGLPDVVVANGSTNGGSTVTVLLNQLGQNATRGNLTVTPEPSIYSLPFSVKLILAPLSGTGVPTGTAVMSVDGTWLATIPVVNGTASYAGSTVYAEGMHRFSAAYSGDASFLPAEYAVQHKVAPLVLPTTTTLVASTTSAKASTTVRFTATVGASGKVPEGSVGFSDGSTTIGSALLDSNGKADFETALLAPGTHSVTANYIGATHFAPSKSAASSVTVTAISTSTTLSSSTGTVQLGSVLSLSVNVSASSGSPFGSVTVFDGATALQTVSLTSGASIAKVVLLATGQHLLKARFNANGEYSSSTSQILPIDVSTGSGTSPSSVAIVAEHQGGSALTISATVNSNVGTATGYVTFLDGSSPIGESALTNDSASLTFRGLAPGTHSFRAVYVGDSRHAFGVSQVLLETISSAASPDYGMSIPSRLLSVYPNSSATVDIAISPINGFSEPVALTCSTEMAGLTCNVTPSRVLGSSRARLTVSFKNVQQTRMAAHKLTAIGWGIFVFAGLLMTNVGKKGRLCLVVLVVCLFGMSIVGCGAQPGAGQLTPTTVTVIGSAQVSETALTHSLQVQVEASR
jgi:hypothetical protein